MKWSLCVAFIFCCVSLPLQGATPTVAPSGHYAGQVVARVQPAAGTQTRESGRASAAFVDLGGGRSRLELKGSLRKRDDAGFVVTGASDASGWRSQGDGLQLNIDNSGGISGGGVLLGREIRIGGRINAEQLRLTTETTRLAASPGGKAGTRVVLDYTLKAQPATASGPGKRAAGADTANKKVMACKRRVWQTRNVAAPNGTMTMIQVPVCRD